LIRRTTLATYEGSPRLTEDDRFLLAALGQVGVEVSRENTVKQ
jgi:hypothetical protein